MTTWWRPGWFPTKVRPLLRYDRLVPARMMVVLAHRAAPSFEDRIMKSKQVKQGGNRERSVAKEKVILVDDDSLQSKAPGAGSPERGNEQSGGNATPATANRGSQQGGFGGSEEGERGGVGAQQSGWSSRQQAERMERRAEEARRGETQQSGYGGAEQHQHAGSQESPTGPPGAQQSGTSGAQQPGGTTPPPSDSGSKRSKRGDRGQ